MSNNLTLWYASPAREWQQALPLGNGRLGAMLFGDPAVERVLLNEETVWTGGPYDPSREGGVEALPEIRRLVFEGRHKEAHYLFGRTMMGEPRTQMKYQPLGNLLLHFDGLDDVREYRRDLDLGRAVASVSFRSGDVQYRRECFVSFPDQVAVVRLSADRPGSLSFTMDLSGGQKGHFEGDGTWERSVAPNGRVTIRGRTPSLEGIEGRVRFEAVTEIRADGGDVTVLADGGVRVDAANDVVVLVSAATNVVSFSDVSADQHALAESALAQACKRSIGELEERHVRDHQQLFGRVDVCLPETKSSELPTDERLKAFTKAGDPALAALYYQFGRYLLIASSRPGCVPANLQGIWNESSNPSWSSKFTTNINLEMNYWPAEVSNLPECVEPLVTMVEGLSQTGREVARKHYGAGGWVFHQNADLWLAPAPMDGPSWGAWPTGGAWLCQHLWEHFLYTRDTELLKRIYPLLKDCAQFFLDTLVEHPEKGWLVTCPSSSPENFPGCPGNARYYDDQLRHYMPGTTICAGPTMDMQILRDLFANCASAAEELGIDESLRGIWQSTRERLAPMQIGRKGNLQEWLEDVDDIEYEHRHLSHLYGAFPSDQITPEATPELARAVEISLHERGDGGTGFGMAWKSALWARLNDGEHALACFADQVRGNTCTNLFSQCFGSPQVDGTFGACAAIAEMLLQSHGGVIRPLPALPDSWTDGSFRGLRARGAVTVDCTWAGGRIRSLVLRPDTNGTVTVQAPAGSTVRRIACGDDEVTAQRCGPRTVRFESVRRQEYHVAFSPHRASAPARPRNPELFQTDFAPAEFAQRRARVFDGIGADASAVIQGAAALAKFEMFRQTNQFYYLCGVEVPHAYLLLRGSDRRTILFLPRRGQGRTDQGGSFAAEDDALIRRMTGIDEVRASDTMERCLRRAKALFVPHAPQEGHMEARDTLRGAMRQIDADPWDGLVPREERFIARLRDRFPAVEIKDLSPVLDEMRRVKSPTEIELLRVAGKLSALAVTEAMKAARPGMNECELHAIAQYVYRAHGARGEGYRAIVPNGRNVWFMHYVSNSNELEDGNLVLMDGAPDYHYYTSDIGRMFPVNGRYSQWQRSLYGFVVEHHKALLRNTKPGLMADEVLRRAAAEVDPLITRRHMSKSVYLSAARKLLESKRPLSHPVGMAVHDAGNYKDKPLEPGVVLTIDPELFIPEERLYIRVEDTVVVTEDGIENLTADAPLELDDVEALMHEQTGFALLDE